MSETRYGHMVHEYYVQRVRGIMDARRKRLEEITTRRQAQEYVLQVREAVKRSFGKLPERTPLNPRLGGRKECDGYLIEKIVYESRPGFLVTGNLYLPRPRSGKAPGVLGLCGHALAGKGEGKYQAFCQGLARRGFVTFIIDPIGQGERRQFLDADGGAAPGLCEGHNIMGNQQVLLDDFFGSWRVWDAIRGLDYLLSRPEVDASRIGVTGNSGGGTLTTYLTALDARITMAAPSCYICSYEANLENEIPSDAEQNPPGIIAAGLDQADLLLCYAPRPTLVLSQIDDFFDERCARRSFEEVRRMHELLGHGDDVEYFAGPHGHGFHQENREAMYAFFLKHAGMSGAGAEDASVPASPEELYATPGGDTAEAGARRVLDFTRDASRRLREGREPLGQEEMIAVTRTLLSIPGTMEPPHYRPLPHYRQKPPVHNRGSQFAVETEPGIQAILTTFGPPHMEMHPPTGPLTVFVGHAGAERDIESVPEIRGLTQGERPLVAVDPRGFGRTEAQACGPDGFFAPYGSDYLYASTGEMLGESCLGRRVFDVLRSLDFLMANGATQVELIGRGIGSVIVAFAALLHPSGPAARLIHYLPSFQMLVDDPLARWPLSSLPRGILRHYDLPDLYAVLGRRASRGNPWDARMAEAQ